MTSQLELMRFGVWLDKIRANLNLHRKYLEVMENFLEVEAQNERQRLAQLADEQTQKAREEIDAGKRIGMTRSIIFSTTEFGVFEWEMVDEFAFTLRKTFFVNLYGFWESQLHLLCRSLKNYNDNMPLPGDVKAFGPEKAKPFLHEIGFPLGTGTWNEIDGYRVLRNCINHHNGQIDRMSDKDQRRIEKFVRSNFLKDWEAEKVRGQDVYRSDFVKDRKEVLLRKGACEKALDIITKYFDELWDALVNWGLAQRAS